ncbi:ATP-binding protein [Streptomyces sp. NPDC006367]|uniref:ATP-binding protein n=1 Tax=unclassified Streptomyces TaxID=2593676 RepID=UPI00339FED55
MDRAAVTAPVLHEMRLVLPANVSASSYARIAGRTRLTMLNWPGPIHAAVNVLGILVDNAVEHALTPGPDDRLSARLALTEDRRLLIDVTDPHPQFPDFDEAVNGAQGRGLWHARRLGAHLSWFITSDVEGKTVRAVLEGQSR